MSIRYFIKKRIFFQSLFCYFFIQQSASSGAQLQDAAFAEQQGNACFLKLTPKNVSHTNSDGQKTQRESLGFCFFGLDDHRNPYTIAEYDPLRLKELETSLEALDHKFKKIDFSFNVIKEARKDRKQKLSLDSDSIMSLCTEYGQFVFKIIEFKEQKNSVKKEIDNMRLASIKDAKSNTPYDSLNHVVAEVTSVAAECAPLDRKLQSIDIRVLELMRKSMEKITQLYEILAAICKANNESFVITFVSSDKRRKFKVDYNEAAFASEKYKLRQALQSIKNQLSAYQNRKRSRSQDTCPPSEQ